MPATARPRPATRSTAPTWRAARPGCRSRSTCRPRPATTATTRWPPARSARSACRSARSRDMPTLFEGIPLEQMNTSMTINATAPWLLALYIVVAQQQGAARAKLQGTVQNDIIKEYLARGTYIFPPQPVAAADHRRDRLHLPRAAGAGTRPTSAATTCRRPAPRRCRSWPTRWPTAIAVLDAVARRRPGARGRFAAGGRPDQLLRQRRASASSPRCARCAPSSSCGTRSRRERYGVEDPEHPPFPLRRAGQLAGPDRAAAREQRLPHPAGDAGGHAVQVRPRPRGPAAGLERGAGPAAPLGPAMVPAHAADPGLRDRSARVPRPVRRLARGRGQGRRS